MERIDVPRPVEITPPAVLPEDDAATLQQWLVGVGDEVYSGERIAEVILPGVLVSVAAPCSGRLVEIVTGPAGRVRPGQVLGWIAPESAT